MGSDCRIGAKLTEWAPGELLLVAYSVSLATRNNGNKDRPQGPSLNAKPPGARGIMSYIR